MWFPIFLYALPWAASFGAGSASTIPKDVALPVRNALGATSNHGVRSVKNALLRAGALASNLTFNGTASFDKSFNNAVLFNYEVDGSSEKVPTSASIEIICTTCYITGTASADLSVTGNFSSQVVQSLVNETIADIYNVTNATIHSLESYFEKLASNTTFLSDSLEGLLTGAEAFPTIDVDFNLDLSELVQATLQIQLDGLELYVQLDTVLNADATYDIRLFTSDTPIGLGLGQDLELGVVFTIDLILSADADVDISTGFHIQFDDGANIEIGLFSEDVTSAFLQGGHFEFLPITVQSGGVVLSAILKLGVQAGIEVATPSLSLGPGLSIGASAGIVTLVYIDIANLTTNVAITPQGDDQGCELRVQEIYELDIGCGAGATIAIDNQTWGPDVSTELPLFSATLANVCAIQGNKTSTGSGVAASTAASASAAPTTNIAAATQTSWTKAAATTTSPATQQAMMMARQAQSQSLTTTTLTTTLTLSAVGCLSTGLANCPGSLQTSSRTTSISTFVTAVPSGVTATFPATTVVGTVSSTVAFGANAQAIVAVTSTAGGPPTFLTPTPSSAASSGAAGASAGAASGGGEQSSGGGKNIGLIVGLSVGLGVPFLLAVAGALYYFFGYKKYAAVPQQAQTRAEATVMAGTEGSETVTTVEKKTSEVTTTVGASP